MANNLAILFCHQGILQSAPPSGRQQWLPCSIAVGCTVERNGDKRSDCWDILRIFGSYDLGRCVANHRRSAKT